MAILPPWLMLAIMSRKALPVAGHFQPHIEAFQHAQLLLHFAQAASRWCSRRALTPIFAREFEPVRDSGP